MAEQASYRDSAAGWDVFRQADGEISRTGLNQALSAGGYRKIAERTFTHYRKLLRLGYEEYVSINRLDLRHSNDSVFNIADRSRYSDRVYESSGRLFIPRRRTTDVFRGQITRISDGFATFVVPGSPEALAVGDAQIYNKGVLVFNDVDVERAVEVVESRDRGPFVEMLLSFRSLLETDLVYPDTTFETAHSRLRISLGSEPSFAQVLEVIRRSFDLFESARGLIEFSLVDAQHPEPLVLRSPRVERLQVRNPVVIDLLLDHGVYLAVGAAVTWGTNHVHGIVQSKKTLKEIVNRPGSGDCLV